MYERERTVKMCVSVCVWCVVCACVCEREIERTVVMPAAVMAELKNSVNLLSLKLAGRLVTCSLFDL